jgi:hypothetical protein
LFEAALMIAENDVILMAVHTECLAAIARMRDPKAIPFSQPKASLARARARFAQANRLYAELAAAKARAAADETIAAGNSRTRDRGQEKTVTPVENSAAHDTPAKHSHGLAQEPHVPVHYDEFDAMLATWEEIRFAREKTQLPERAYQEELKGQAQGETECMLAKPGTALDHSRGLEKKFPYYQAIERRQMQAARRRAHALRELERWNKGLGRKARELSDRVIWAETICPAKRPAQVAVPLAPTGEETR